MGKNAPYSPLRWIAAGALLFVAGQGFAQETDNCKAPVKPDQDGPVIAEKLDRCNGVLTPAHPADGDIVVPTPHVDDPLAIHPQEVPGNQGTAK